MSRPLSVKVITVAVAAMIVLGPVYYWYYVGVERFFAFVLITSLLMMAGPALFYKGYRFGYILVMLYCVAASFQLIGVLDYDIGRSVFIVVEAIVSIFIFAQCLCYPTRHFFWAAKGSGQPEEVKSSSETAD